MEWWQIILTGLVSLTVIITFVIAGIGGWKKANYRAAIEALEATNKTQEFSITTLRGEILDLRENATLLKTQLAEERTETAKKEAVSSAKIATLETEVKNLLSQRPSINILEDISNRLDTYYDTLVLIMKDKK